MKSDLSWLDRWAGKIRNKSVLELGAGSGIDSEILRGIAKDLIATDLVENPDRGIIFLDHSKSLPFCSGSFDVVIASLSLHYFEWKLTEQIVREIHRVLKPNGLLIGRLNSVADINYGAIGYPRIEEGLFNVENQKKRFFTKSDLFKLFEKKWNFESISEKQIDRYEMTKTIWEFAVTCA